MTLRDIAKEAGLSLTTVSMSLRSDPRIPAATAGKAKAVAARLGYRPDPGLSEFTAARWRAGASREGTTLGYLYNPKSMAQTTGRICRGAGERAEELGYRIEKFSVLDYEKEDAMQRVLRARNIRGLLLDIYEPPAVRLNWGDFCAVNCRLGSFLPPLHTVYQDVFSATRELWHGAHQRGYRRIGFAMFVGGHDPLGDDALRDAAILWTRAKSKKPTVPPIFLNPLKGWWHSTVKWYRRWKPDAVLGLNIAILQALEAEGGVKVPGEVGFARLAATRDEEAGRVAGLVDADHSIGRAALDQLDLCLRTHQYGLPDVRIHHLIEPRWQEGASMPARV
ncbi:MAG: LacI family DNA-binding transcriptional regulator [Verrucomicrobiae bacterium]